eukprot:GHVS01088331.1.p1 GENE.GHVS01088331.1~~GHVS01088331.1.p1  ORF type:complete len:568 (+),score=66.72 GHVS01088331.1:745-2448(+)
MFTTLQPSAGTSGGTSACVDAPAVHNSSTVMATPSSSGCQSPLKKRSGYAPANSRGASLSFGSSSSFLREASFNSPPTSSSTERPPPTAPSMSPQYAHHHHCSPDRPAPPNADGIAAPPLPHSCPPPPKPPPLQGSVWAESPAPAVESSARGSQKARLGDAGGSSSGDGGKVMGVENRGSIGRGTESGSGGVAMPSSVSTAAPNASNGSGKQYTYNAERVIGNGSFGVVYQAQVVETRETVAIKKVFQDKRYKNRELQIMRELRHPNIVQLKHAFYTSGDKPDELYLNVVMEYLGETVYRVMKQYLKSKQVMPMLYVKLYTYQMCRSLAYIHYLGICHRDIKPQNLLVDTNTHVLKLCDFGSAKRLTPGEPNVAYICSRYYRAPELIFGSTDYTTAIDIWSMGCVMAEMILGQPLFPGESGVDQLVEIIKVLGTPTREQLMAMNPNYTEFKFPQIKAVKWDRVFKNRHSPDATDLLSRLLQYDPSLRLKPMQALTQPFFDEIRDQNSRLPNQRPLQNIFNFTEEELSLCTPEMRNKLVPRWARKLPETSEYLSCPFEEFHEQLNRRQ